MNLKILYQDNNYVAVHKPPGLLVHRTNLASDENLAALQLIRDQTQKKVFPVHRIDRPTSGVLVFAFSKEAATHLGSQFLSGQVKKRYIAIVRGKFKGSIELNYPLKEIPDNISDRLARSHKPAQSAITRFRALGTVELPMLVDKYPTSHYSLIEAIPQTGRKHQIRRHLKHLSHPIVGDINYGNGKHNKFFEQQLQNKMLFLIAKEIEFTKLSGDTVKIETELCPQTIKALQFLGLDSCVK